MAETIRFRYIPDAGTYSRVMRAHTLRTRGVWLTLAAITAVLLVMLVAPSLLRHQAPAPASWLAAVGGPLFAGFLLFVWQPSRVKRQVQKQEQFRSETTWQVDDSQSVIQNAQSEIRLGWDNFCQAMETRTDFHLVYAANKRQIQFVPKRAFESPEQEVAFRTLLHSKLRVVRWV